MANPKVNVNLSTVNASIAKEVERVTLPIARGLVKQQFEDHKKEMIQEIVNHPVSKELSADGRRRMRKSKFIISDHRANLFAFLGFVVDRQPVQELINIIDENFKVDLRTKLIKNNYTFKVKYMNTTELEKLTPMDWSRRSWLSAIEDGLSNINYFISKLGKGRSQGGYQSKKPVNNTAEFVPTSFITPIINKFKSKIRKGK